MTASSVTTVSIVQLPVFVVGSVHTHLPLPRLKARIFSESPPQVVLMVKNCHCFFFSLCLCAAAPPSLVGLCLRTTRARQR